MMRLSERLVIDRAIRRIKGDDPRTAAEVREMLKDPGLTLFLDTWVCGPLRLLAKPDRTRHQLSMAVEMSK